MLNKCSLLGANEQYRGSDFTLREKDQAWMIDNASELAHGLKALETGGLLVKWTFFPDESYPSVPLATIGRAVWFALRTRPGQVPAP